VSDSSDGATGGTVLGSEERELIRSGRATLSAAGRPGANDPFRVLAGITGKYMRVVRSEQLSEVNEDCLW
jgi:hypothetical protein